MTNELRVEYGVVDRVMGVALVGALLTSFVVLRSPVGRLALVLALAVAVVGTIQAFTRRLDIGSHGLVLRDVFGRTHTFSRTDVAEVTYDRTTVLQIMLKGGRVIRFPARARNAREAFALLG